MEQLKRRDRKLIRKGHIFEYYEDTLELPDGKEALYDFINHKGAAAKLLWFDSIEMQSIVLH